MGNHRHRSRSRRSSRRGYATDADASHRRKTVEQIGLPYHWGYSGLVKGDIGNDLVAISEEPNVRIMETKGLLCTYFGVDDGRIMLRGWKNCGPIRKHRRRHDSDHRFPH